MDPVDVTLALLIGYFTYRGYSRGVLVTLASIASPVLGVVAALRFSGAGADWAAGYVRAPELVLDVIAYPLVFLATVVAVRLTARLFSAVFELGSAPLSRLAGAAVGGLTAVLLLGTGMVLLEDLAAGRHREGRAASALTERAYGLIGAGAARLGRSHLGPRLAGVARVVLDEVLTETSAGPEGSEVPEAGPA